MNPLWKTRITAVGCSLLAIAIGWWLANGNYGIPVFLCAVAGAACVVALSGVAIDTAVLGGLLFGYIVGNRGFAQFSLVPGLPVLPAEAGLALCAAWLIIRSAWDKKLPFRRDSLDVAVLLWMTIGAARIIPDVRNHGFVALRDFAMIYYAAFYFIAQALVSNAANRQFLDRCLLGAVILLVPLAELFRRFPDFFLGTLVFGGIPLIFFKGDLVATFMAIGVVLTHRRWEGSRRILWLLVALFGSFGILVTGNRASLVGLFAATLWLCFGRRFLLLRNLLIVGVVGGIGVIFAQEVGAISSRENFGLSVYERILSIADISGTRDYASQNVEFKGDNNRFRLVWWESIFEETWAGNPWLGLGFGHDLAAGFVRRYFPDSDEEFTARSPHSIVITIFARMGVLGLVAFLGILAVMMRRTWHALHSSPADEARVTAWLPPWVVLTSALFGVVLEGPMGAVVFWTTLGMAAGTRQPAPSDPESGTGAPAVEQESPASERDLSLTRISHAGRIIPTL